MNKADVRLLILHEFELRQAAKSLEAALNAQGTDSFPGLAQDALNACIVALHGLHDEEQFPIVMVSSTRNLIGELESVP